MVVSTWGIMQLWLVWRGLTGSRGRQEGVEHHSLQSPVNEEEHMARAIALLMKVV